MHPARKPLATLAITLGTFLIMLGAPALAGADDANADLDAAAVEQTRSDAVIAAADDADAATADDVDGAETDGSADADGTAVVGPGSAIAADSVAVDGVAVSGESVVGPDVAVNGDNANADGTDTDSTDGGNVLGANADGDNADGDNANGGAGASSDNGNSTGADGGGNPSPAANDPILGNTAITPAAAPQNTDRNLPDAGGPASMVVLLSGLALIVAGIVILSHGRIRVARHRA